MTIINDNKNDNKNDNNNDNKNDNNNDNKNDNNNDNDDNAAKKLHWELCKNNALQHKERWYEHNP